MNHFLQLGESKELEDWTLGCIPEKCSFKAVNSNGDIIGVFLSGIVEKSVSTYINALLLHIKYN